VNGLPLCQISSWLSGRRLVSLPFSDHCAPLVESSEQLTCMLAYLRDKIRLENWRYVELRPTNSLATDYADFGKSKFFCFHKLALRPSLAEIFRSVHKDCVQRKIQRAVREGIDYGEGRSGSLLTQFYHLFLMTRRRHGLPPQPLEWFQNLLACLGDGIKIRVASKDGRPIAAILTLRFKHALVYKYGCSDHRFNNLGGTQLLLWRTIQEGKEGQLSEFDMGRSDCDDVGLVAFKDRWATARSQLDYFRYPARYCNSSQKSSRAVIPKYVLSHAPGVMLAAAGKAFYRHMG